ncbi:hypothetical protein FOA43_004824 [Brettanomyces nanus]|uniref:Amidohydrolase-related domain-containing protein n=1 Tax=Eeniella nana TaxID=13502 RepID=A0A875RQL8_EENNA|nr:uncharacterized protein FOA43_004824 [Brettanomyces nanus]QPG77410.1 hypothetical protein FOA43_004824 [Brettanomyces nanus]
MRLGSRNPVSLPVTQDRSRAHNKYNATWFFVVISIIILLGLHIKLEPKPELPTICQYNTIRPHYEPDENRINGRYKLFDMQDTILENATIIDGDGMVLQESDIYISKGTIVNIGKHLANSVMTNPLVVPLNGKFVTPGLIDMHSHFGTRPQPQLFATEDTNEFTNPITPYVRSIDGIDPNDPDMDSLLASGVTSHLVLTGSKNLISGESYAIKLHKPPHNLVKELLVQYDLIENGAKPVRRLKMAYGENEKNWKLQRGQGYPVSRMGENALLREAFDSARRLKKKQDQWCSDSKIRGHEQYPTDINQDLLVSVLRGDINVNVHVYETYDMESLLRTADEYGFHINAFHHALSSWKIPELLKEHNVTIALFADEWGGKKEQYQGSVYQPKLLDDAGISVALKTDHPALPGQELLFFAQIAYNFGLPQEKAIASVTSIPAKSIGLSHRIGYLRKGYDADLAIWNDHPLTLGVHPLEVIVDGEPRFSFTKLNKETLKSIPLQRKQLTIQDSCRVGLDSFILKGIKKSLIPLSGNVPPSIEVIDKGNVSFFDDEKNIEDYIKKGFPVIQLQDGYVVPGGIAVSPSVGLREMELEEDTSDGSISGVEFIHAADGIHMDGLVIKRLHRTGIAGAITAPIGNSFIKGISTYVKFAGEDLNEVIAQRSVAVHFNIGNKAKKGQYSTISSQIEHIRRLLREKPETLEGLPIAVHTHNSGIMRHIIGLKKEFPKEKFIIIGGQEAYLIADKLASADISLILAPWHCTAKFWDNRFCSPNEPLENESSVQILHKAGVQFALGEEADATNRRLFWDSGWASKTIKNFSPLEEAGLVSTTVEQIFGLPHDDDFFVFEHNPYDFGSSLVLSFENGRITQCFPEVEEPNVGDELAE